MSDNMNEKIMNMSLLEMNYNLENRKVTLDDLDDCLDYLNDEILTLEFDENDIDYNKALNLSEKIVVMFQYLKNKENKEDIIENEMSISHYLLYVNFNKYDFFNQKSFDKILGSLGTEIEKMEKRLNKLENLNFYKFYVIVLLITILINVLYQINADTFGFLLTALGGSIVFLFIIFIFCLKFLAAFLIPAAIFMIAHFIDILPLKSAVIFGLIALVISVGLLLYLPILRKIKMKKYNRDLTIYKRSIKDILDILSIYSGNDALERIKNSGMNIDKYEINVYQTVSSMLIRYYNYVLKCLDAIEITK